MGRYSVDDRGNEAKFYDNVFDCYVATLNRESGPPENVDSVTTWDGDEDVTKYAVNLGYGDEIQNAVKG